MDETDSTGIHKKLFKSLEGKNLFKRKGGNNFIEKRLIRYQWKEAITKIWKKQGRKSSHFEGLAKSVIRQSLKGQKIINKLSLEINDQSEVRFLRKLLKKTKCLKILYLKAHYNDETNHALIVVGKIFAESIMFLGRVAFHLRCFQDIKINQGFRVLGKNLRYLRTLQSLYFKFSSCFRLKDQEILDITKYIGSLQSLRSINLLFDECKELTGQVLSYLSTKLQAFKFLQIVTMNFIYCEKLEDQKLLQLGTYLGSLKSLRKLTLGFNKCPKLTYQGIWNLSNSLESLRPYQTDVSVFPYF